MCGYDALVAILGIDTNKHVNALDLGQRVLGLVKYASRWNVVLTGVVVESVAMASIDHAGMAKAVVSPLTVTTVTP